MNNDHFLAAIGPPWAGNLIAWFIGPMSPLQAIVLLVTVGYTIHKWRKDK